MLSQTDTCFKNSSDDLCFILHHISMTQAVRFGQTKVKTDQLIVGFYSFLEVEILFSKRNKHWTIFN